MTIIKSFKNILLHLSIKFKITFCYLILIISIIFISLNYIINICNSQLYKKNKAGLINSVEFASTIVSVKGQNLTEDVQLSCNDTHIVVYNPNGVLIYGNEEFSTLDVPLINKKFHQENINGVTYYVYDLNTEFVYRGNSIVRGYISVNNYTYISISSLRYFILIFSVIIIISAIIGYFITKKSLKPIEDITTITNGFSVNNDKNIRISTNTVSEISSLSNSLNLMFQKLEDAFKKEKDFTSDASHELKTPISVIIAETEYLKTIAKKDEEIKSINTILKQSNRMSKIISELLTLTRMDNKHQQLTFELINLSELLDIVIEEYGTIAKAKHITLIPDISPNIYMNADQTLIMRVFINIINNSIKYGHDGGYTKIILSKTDTKIILSFTDNGIGISKDNLGKIFERFYQVSPSRTNSDGSCGLGLAMVKWIVETHNGSINVDSELDVGTEFKIIFSDIN